MLLFNSSLRLNTGGTTLPVRQITPEDEGALVAAMRQALSDLRRLRKMGEASYRIVAEEINLEKMARQMQEKIHFKNLLVTLGAEGNFIFDGSVSKHLPQPKKAVPADVCGAGDRRGAVRPFS